MCKELGFRSRKELHYNLTRSAYMEWAEYWEICEMVPYPIRYANALQTHYFIKAHSENKNIKPEDFIVPPIKKDPGEKIDAMVSFLNAVSA